MKISDEHKKQIQDLVPKGKQQEFVDKALSTAIAKEKEASADTVEVYCDGGSRGNPGPAGGGYAIYRNGTLIEKGGEYFGEQTNNRAEYLSLRLALREVQEHFPDLKVHCFMDSELVVKQIWGDYKVKNKDLKPLYDEVKRIMDQFPSFAIEHVPRAQNKVADQMANEAMDRG